MAVDPARPRWATPPPAHRRSGRRRAGTTGRPASQPSCGRSWRLALPLRPGLTGSAPTTPARPRRLPPGRAARSKPLGAIRGGREPQGRRPISAPSGRPLRPGRSTANGIGASSRTGIGSGAEGAFRLNAGAPADVAACEIVAPRAPPRPRMGRCDDEARPGRRTCSAAGADGPVAGGPAAQKGGWRALLTPPLAAPPIPKWRNEPFRRERIPGAAGNRAMVREGGCVAGALPRRRGGAVGPGCAVSGR